MSTAAKPPTVAAGAGAGIGATATILAGGNDANGVVELVTGATGAVPGSPIFTLTYGEPYEPTVTQQVTVLPANEAAAESALSIVPSLQGDSKAFNLVGTKNPLLPAVTLRYSYSVTPIL